nr:hypothetical protein CFP56_09793 [Quercus suber]
MPSKNWQRSAKRKKEGEGGSWRLTIDAGKDRDGNDVDVGDDLVGLIEECEQAPPLGGFGELVSVGVVNTDQWLGQLIRIGLGCDLARSQPCPKPLPPPLPFANAATPGSGSQTHMIGLTREMVSFYSFVLGIEYSGLLLGLNIRGS